MILTDNNNFMKILRILNTVISTYPSKSNSNNSSSNNNKNYPISVNSSSNKNHCNKVSTISNSNKAIIIPNKSSLLRIKPR